MLQIIDGNSQGLRLQSFEELYTRLILSGKLYEHLAETDQVCRDRKERMITQMAEAEGINEKLKASDQLGWISQMNSIRSQAEEIVLQEIIYS